MRPLERIRALQLKKADGSRFFSLSLILMLALMAGMAPASFSRDAGRADAPDAEAEADIQAGPQFTANGEPILKAKSAILVDTRTGQVIWEKDRKSVV